MNDFKLHVLHDGSAVGELIYKPVEGEFAFVYDRQWISQGRFAISPHIRAEDEPAKGAVTRFLENLLPEGEALRSLAQMLKLKPGNLYAMISAIGAETTGALVFSRERGELKTTFRPIPREELVERIRERKTRPIINWDGKPRLSVAGVQEKLPVSERNGEFGLGEGRIASTHILKFANERAEHLVLNEYFCMRLAQLAGLNAATCEMLELGERVLKVTRFDRRWRGQERVIRSHVIDGCQALDLAPRLKYERFLGDESHVADITGPATLKNIFAFSTKTRTPARTQLDLLHWVVFCLLIGNSDNHAKNISFFVSDEGISLTPFYDLVSVDLYPQFSRELAFQIGATFVPDEINAYHLAEMASELGLKKSFVASQFKKITQNTLKMAEKLTIEGLTADETRFLEELKAAIAKRCHRYLAELPEITKFRSIQPRQ